LTIGEESLPWGVQEMVAEKMDTDSGALTIGFVTTGLPSWYLFVRGTGRSKWILGKRDLLMCRKGDPPVVVDKQGAFDTLM
jgi:hypothetical protein